MDFLGIKKTNIKRTVILTIIGVVINCILFFGCSIWLELPVWFDTTGVAIVAIMGGFIPAAIVCIINSFITSLLFGAGSFIFIIVSLATAAVFAFFASRKQVNGFISVCGICFLHMIVRITLIMTVTFLFNKPLVNEFELTALNGARMAGFSEITSHLHALFTTNVIEAMGMSILVFSIHSGLMKISKLD